MVYNKDWKGKNSWQKKESPKPYKPKRGKLASLMNEEDKQKAGIHELTYDFGCRVTQELRKEGLGEFGISGTLER